MTEQRKQQLAFEATDGVSPVLERMGTNVQKFGREVELAGGTAGKGFDKIPEGAKRSSDGLEREYGRMRASIARHIADVRSIGKSALEKIEIQAEIKGLDLTRLAPQLEAARELERQAKEAARALQQQQVATGFTDGLKAEIAQLQEKLRLQAMSTEEALRYKAVQAGAANADPLIRQLGELQAAHAAVTRAAQEQAAAERQAGAFIDGLKAQIAVLREQQALRGKSAEEALRFRATQAGVPSATADPLIRELTQLRGGAKLTAHEMQQLGFQVHDFAVQVLSGQSALTAFVQQGSQLSGTFGGAKNAFQAVLSLITPMRLAVAGAAAAFGGLALAMVHAETAARGLNSIQAQLAGTGRGDMFSTASLREFIDQLSQAPGISRDVATQIVSELSKVKDIGGGVFKDVARLAADYAKATGTDIPNAAKELARAFADPEKGAKQLDQTLGVLSSTQLLTIERLSKLGDTAGAQRVLVEALQGSLKGLAENGMTPLQRATDDLGNSWERMMRQFGNTSQLESLNAMLADTVRGVQKLLESKDKLGVLGDGLPGLAIRGGMALREAVLGKPKEAEAGGTAGDFARMDRASGAAAAKQSDDETKRVMAATEGFKSQREEIERLTKTRADLTKEIEKASKAQDKDTEDGKYRLAELRSRLAGVNERIAAVGRRGAGPSGANEAQQIAIAQAQADQKQIQDLLQRRQDAFSFAEQYLQGAYQAGEISLKEYFDRQRENTAAGVDAQIAALEERKARLAKLLADPAFKDPSQRVAVQGQIADIDEQEKRAIQQAGQEQERANQQKTASFKQLNDQVSEYRANLKQLAGDEEGAARIRAEIATRQARELQTQSKGKEGEITDAEVQRLARTNDQNITLTTTRRQISDIQTRQQMREERISQEQRTGGMTTLDSLAAVSDSRRKAVAELEELVRAQEEVAKTRPKDYQLQIDTERARHELELLKGELDPLKQQFDNLFKDAGSNFFNDLMSGKGLKGALKGFGDALSREINGVVSRELSEQLFGKNGALGGAGGFLANIFGKKGQDPKAAVLNSAQIDTTPAQTSINSLAAATNPATQALAGLTQAANNAAGAIAQRAPLPPGIQDVQVSGQPVTSVTAGDSGYSYHDYGATSGEQSVMDMFKGAERSTEDYAKSNAAAGNAVLQLANAAGKGGNALSLLPAIVNAIKAVAASSSSGGGSGAGSFLSSLGGSSTSSASSSSDGYSFTQNGGYTPSADYSYLEYGYSDGGFTGARGEKEVAGVVHGQEYVFSAPAVRAIGLERLESLHKKAKTGKDVDEDLPGYSEGGYVTVSGLQRPQTLQGGSRYLVAMQPAAPVKAGDTYVTNHHYNTSVQAAPGMSRQTALQTGREVGRGIELSRARNGR